MSQSSLTKLWSGVGLFLFYITANSIFATIQAGPTLPGIDLYDKLNHHKPALYGLLIGAVTLILLSILTRSYVKRFPGITWDQRIPPAFALEISPNDSLSRGYQAVMFMAFLVVPALGMVFLLGRFFEGRIYDDSPRPQTVVEGTWFEHLTASPHWSGYCYGAAPGCLPEQGCLGFAPLFESWGVLVLSVLAIAMAVRAMLTVFRGFPNAVLLDVPPVSTGH